MTTKTDTARDQAEAQLAHIVELMDWLDHAESCEYGECDHDLTAVADYGLTVDDSFDTDTVMQAIHEYALDVEVNYGWHSVSSFTQPGESPKPEAFAILLCTGGPAVRIMGELNEHAEPVRAWLEYQDWGTPWTEYVEAEYWNGARKDTLLRFSSQFYFGQ